MAVKITEICIACGSCIDECPVGAIVDDSQNPEGEDRYYVYANKCVLCGVKWWQISLAEVKLAQIYVMIIRLYLRKIY